MSTLSQSDWIAAGFRALTAIGPSALKAEPLARTLGATKGSFYWHFTDVPAFQNAMLRFWAENAVERIIVEVEKAPTAAMKLRRLSQLVQTEGEPYGGVGTEPAIRAWARSDPRVAEELARVDAGRVAYLAQLLKQLGIGNPDMPKLIYAALIGLEEMASRSSDPSIKPLETLIDLVIALGRD